MGMLAAAAASAILASLQTPQGHRTLSGVWRLRLRSASPGVAALRLHDFVPKCYMTKVEVDVSNVNNEEDFKDHPSLAPSCSIPLIPFRGDVLDSTPFSLHDRTSRPSDFEELPVLSEGEQHALASTPAHPSGLYALYASYLFGNLVEQPWNFAWPAALAILHPSLLPVAIFSVFIGAPIVGKIMDHFPRIPMYTALNAVQVSTQLISAGLVMYALRNVSHASSTAWFSDLGSLH